MIAAIQAAGELFTQVIRDLDDEVGSEPSLLPGWSRAHVIAHVALNAEGFVVVAAALRAGSPALMYPGGTAARDAEINALSQVRFGDLLSRFEQANTNFVAAWDPAPPSGDCATADGHPLFASSSVFQRRLRELQVHMIDLNMDGVDIDHWTDAFIESDLALQWPTVAHRTDTPLVVIDELGARWEAGKPPARIEPLATSRRELLAWVLDRGSIEGLPTLEPWSNRSKWELP